MSSWQEYKKKKQGNNNTTSSSNSEMSSWQRYKQEKQNNVKLSTVNKTNKRNDISNIFGNFGYGLSNGLISFQQQLNRVTKKGINDRLSAGNEINSKLNLPTSQEMLKNMLGEDSDKPITNIGEKLEKQKQSNKENIQKNIDNSSNIVTKKLAENASSIGEMVPGMLPVVGSTYFAGSAAGNYYDEAKQRGMTEKEAEKYSAIMGLAEGGAEALGGKITKSVGKNLIKGKSKEALKMFGLDILENFAEEAIMEPLSEATATVTAGKDKANWDNIGERMLQSGFDGAIVATIMGGASAGIGSSVNIVNKVIKGEKVTSNDINTAKKDVQNKMTDAEVQNKIKEAEAIINSINKTQQNNIVENTEKTNQKSNFEMGLEKFKSKQYKQIDNITVLDELPNYFYNMGYNTNQPLMLNMKKLENIMKVPKGYTNGVNQHGITMDIVEKLPEAINNPLNVIKNPKFNNRYVIVTDLTDQYGDIVIVPVEIKNNEMEISGISKISSIYGKETYDVPATNDNVSYMEQNKDNIVYDIDNERSSSSNYRLQLPSETRTTSINNSIPQLTKNVKDNSIINNNSMQNIKNNTLNTTESNVQKYNRYKQNILKGRAEEVNNLIKNKNQTINEIEQQIKEKEQLLNNKKDKTTKVANNLKMQIENLKQRKVRVENEYNSRIDIKFNKVTKDKINMATKKELGLTRKAVRQQLIQEMHITEEDLQIGRDIKSLNFQFTDPIRVNEKVFGQIIGQKINDVTINRTKHNTAEKTRWLNKERGEISELGIKARSKESAAVQKYGEKQYINEAGKIQKYGDKELSQEFSNKETQEKIKKAAKVIREKYDIYIEQINEVLTSLGYDVIPKRTDYMRHFQELGDMFSKTGVPFNLNDMKAEDLPTDINGLTEFNKPGKNWFASSQKRYGNQTTYDAITGIDGYLEGAGNLIYHTEDIQRYRALSELIRDTFGQTKGFDNLDGLSDKQLQQRIEDIKSNKLSKYVAWLEEQANSLSGKKATIDRVAERTFGRRVYTLMNTLKKQVGSNMTGFNVRSALTNLISSTIAAGKTNKIALAKGTISTINNMFKNDGFIDKSDFLTSRFGSNSLSQKLWQKASNAGQIFMTGTDYFTANIIARSKYYEGLQRGMTEQQAMRYSNDFSSRVMGDRSQGATAEIFNSKALGLFTQFQLEVNNQWQYMIHDTKMDYQKNSSTDGKAKAGATVLFQLGQIAAYSYFFNELFESLTGSRAAFDPIEIIKVLFGVDDEDKEKSFDERVTKAIGLLVDHIPLGNLITGGGRIPIAEALTGIETLTKKVTGQKNSYGGEISWKDVQDDLLSSAPYWVFPTGYGAIKKSAQGINTIINGGDYVTNSKGEKELRFPIEDKNVGDYLKAGIFGKYALPLAKEYVNRDYERLSAKQTETYEASNLPYKEFLQYIDADLSTKQEKLDYLNKQDWNDNQKWGIFTRDILSSTKRKDGTSQLSDAQYIIKNGVSKKKFMQLYNKANEYDISIPTETDYKKLRKEGTTLEEYINDKIAEKKKKANK